MNIRNSARAVMVNERGEMLLLKFIFGSKTWWVTPGGGLEEGESFEEALKREVFEETGVKLDQIGPWVWTKEIVLEIEERTVLSHERYYLVRVAGQELELGNMTELEKDTLLDIKWWSAAEIRQVAGREPFSISRLDELLTAINEGKIPERPVKIE
mgnify:CR=1 FL=1|jgi:ADP-ribose pyrophosphatase